jgi:hypothetical protein
MDGQDQDILVGGKSYRMSKFDLNTFQQFAHWAKARLSDPYAEIAKLKDVFGMLAPEVQKDLIAKAEARASTFGTIQDERIMPLASTWEGANKLFSLLFAKCNPSMTPAELEDLTNRALMEHVADLEDIISKAVGSVEMTESEVEAEYLVWAGKLQAMRPGKALPLLPGGPSTDSLPANTDSLPM